MALSKLLFVFIYIDPGSGSLLLQVILASFLSILTFSQKVKLFIGFYFRKIFKRGEQVDEK